MRAYQKERFLNAICYFAREHSKRTGKAAFQTYIYKYLALFDFAMLEEEGKPALDIDYKAMQRGPVPADLYSGKTDTSHYEFLKVEGPRGEERYVINPLADPDMDYFSEEEKRVMDAILEEFTAPGITIDDLIRATHDRIPAWTSAWARRGSAKSAKMDYSETFPAGVSSENAARYQLHEELTRHGSRRCDPVGAL